MSVRAILAAGGRVSAPVVVVVAHPDDETAALGGVLQRLDDATLVHVTDGAPRDGADATAAGARSMAEYAAMREAELQAALRELRVSPRRVRLEVADRQAVHALAPVTRALAPLLAQASCVIAHALEGGHPDHDAVALAVRAASRGLRLERLEFPLYGLDAAGREVWGAFADASPGAVEIALTVQERARKRRALARFASQAATLAHVPEGPERLRPAHGAALAPPSGRYWYDARGWEITGARWRVAAASGLRGLQAAPC